MQPPLDVGDVLRLLVPMFDSMLTDDELDSLEFAVISTDDGSDGPALDPSAPLSTGETHVRWHVLGHRGSSGGLRLDENADEMIRFVQGDLQDWLSTTDFAWGQLRGPVGLP